MKDQSRPTHSHAVSRREFLGQSAAAAMGFSIVPRRVLGGAGYVAPSDKINMAFIGVGDQGLRVMLYFLREADVQGVAVCDVNKGSAPITRNGSPHEFCNSVRKLLGVDSGWDWLSPDDPLQLTHTLLSHQAASQAANHAQKIVDGYYGSQLRSGEYHGCAAYSDFRELLEKQKDLDAVVVCTTDHLHADGFCSSDEETQTRFLPEAIDTHQSMRRDAWRRSRGKPEWPRRLRSPIRPRRIRAYCANGFGVARSDRCAK